MTRIDHQLNPDNAGPPLPAGPQQSSAQLENLIAKLSPDKDNTETIEALATENYDLLTNMIVTHRNLPNQVLAMIVYGIANNWTLNADAAQKALSIAAEYPDAWIQREALDGLDEIQRYSAKAP